MYARRPWDQSRLVEGPNPSKQNQSSTLDEGMVFIPLNNPILVSTPLFDIDLL